MVRKQQSQTEEALYRSQQQQSLVIQSLPLALYLSSVKDGFQSREFVGGSTQDLCGLEPSEFSREPKLWFSRLHKDDQSIVVRALEQAATTGSFSAEYRWRCADDSYRWFSDRGTVVPSKNGGLELFGVWLDVSERHKLQKELAHAQRIEAIGTMTGGIAHDFNNMLSVILGSLEQLKRSDNDDPKNQRRIDLALKATNSCSDMTRRLLGFARQQELEPVVLDMRDEIESITDLLNQSIGDDVELVVECADDAWTVYIDRAQLESAILNLVVNAGHAMPDGGKLTVKVTNQEIGGTVASELEIESGSYVQIAVADTGTGMSEGVIQRAFEPFFTTKGVSKGTGLGLSTVHGFLKQSDGAITIESEVGAGTTVRLFVPRCHTSFSEKPPESPSGDRGKAIETLTVLVVEDEQGLREMAVSMLEEIGCITIEAGDADEALKQFEKNPSISLLFSDCMMPGKLNGPQLAEEVVRRRPEIPVLLSSAYGSPDGKDPKFGFLAKPYGPSELEAAIRKLANVN